jgi:hydroxyethylthiazole kinase-like uncharacterized protein yjeF
LLETERIISVKDMRILELNAHSLGVKRDFLMESAGRGLADFVVEKIKNFHGEKKTISVVIFSGLGNNGGDGFVAARYLTWYDDFDITVMLLGLPSSIRSKEAFRNFQILDDMECSVKILKITDSSQVRSLKGLLGSADVVIDSLLGTGVSGVLREPYFSAVKAILDHGSNAFIVSVDVPTGVDPDTGNVSDIAVKADVTVTFHSVKKGLLKAKEYVGEIKVVNIGIPSEAGLFVGPGDVLVNVVERKPAAHKGDFGRVLIIGGSKMFSGAPALSAMAALRTGSDLAIIIAPESVSSAIKSFSPNLIVQPLEGEIITSDLLMFNLLKMIEKAKSIVIGPGLGSFEESMEAAKAAIEFCQEKNIPLVIDADAIKAVADFQIKFKKDSVVITPHEGELKTLFGEKFIPSNLDERMLFIKEKAAQINATILFKAPYDIISEGDRVKINRTGNPGMTVGGTGDVLTGIVGTFLSQGKDTFSSACVSAYINGFAGDLAVEERGFHIIATDVIEKIPRTFKKAEELTEI